MDGATASRSAPPTAESVEIPVQGGHLAFTRFVSSDACPRACVIVNCAMGVGQKFYWSFAKYLADAGYVAITWDYRGVGESVLEPREARRVSLEQWAFGDFSLVLAAARRDHPPPPI